ncbi:MAG: RNA-binding domain-containing protein [Thermoproteota archaeon]|jgi:predicted RNA binding protein with dsRBD fold (UPF0201 family)|nr:RNA-binding domain-containing protein [Thermoproteota archaeon]
MLEIIAKVEIKPTEDEGKVRIALENVFDFEKIELIEELGSKYYVAKSYSLKSLNKIANLIKKQRIELTARSILERSIENNSLSFKLNKQAAYMNRISFVTIAGEAPLGAIEIKIISDDPMKIIDMIAPLPKAYKTAKSESERNLEQ